MSNLATIKVAPSTEYQNLATLAGISFTTNGTYIIQIEGDVKICEKETKPTPEDDLLEGYHITFPKPFTYIAKKPLWIRNLEQYNNAVVNIGN